MTVVSFEMLFAYYIVVLFIVFIFPVITNITKHAIKIKSKDNTQLNAWHHTELKRKKGVP